jgi:hypothetical protein
LENGGSRYTAPEAETEQEKCSKWGFLTQQGLREFLIDWEHPPFSRA